MFDRLIESEPESADFKSRWSYFMVSSLVVGIFFVTAVVFSLFAADISLGHDNFVLSTIVAPPDMEPPMPENQDPQPIRNTAASDSPVPIRQINMSNVDEPHIVPPTTSTAPVTALATPKGYYEIRDYDSEPSSYGGPARGVSGSTGGPAGTGLAATSSKPEVSDPEPPPVVRRPPARPEPPRSLGVVNGRASHLPKPAYPAAAIALNIQGKVDVQVLIDESGKVVSAKAINGHPLLKYAAVRSALNARFTPTKLSEVPVKVTGVIVYNFTR